MLDTSASLLHRLRQPADTEAWGRLVELYTPVLRAWLRQYEALADVDVDDLVQDVLVTVSKEVSRFEPVGPGAFRGWLRTILVNRLRHFWRMRQRRPAAVGGTDFLELLDQLGRDDSAAARRWDQEHDRHVVGRLLELVEPRFAPPTWLAFRRQMLDGRSADEVAAELHMPIASVYAARSRVLKALRTEADGLVSM